MCIIAKETQKTLKTRIWIIVKRLLKIITTFQTVYDILKTIKTTITFTKVDTIYISIVDLKELLKAI